jgi:hypothetical protein
MAGFNFTPPVQQIPPELLARIAAAAFRPPPGMGMPAMQLPSMQPVPGFNVTEGLNALTKGLAGLKGIGGGGSSSRGGPAGLGSITDRAAQAAADKYGPVLAPEADWGQMLSPNNPSYGDLGMPAAGANGGGFIDFLTGLFSQFGGSGGGAAGGLGDLAGGFWP